MAAQVISLAALPAASACSRAGDCMLGMPQMGTLPQATMSHVICYKPACREKVCSVTSTAHPVLLLKPDRLHGMHVHTCTESFHSALSPPPSVCFYSPLSKPGAAAASQPKPSSRADLTSAESSRTSHEHAQSASATASSNQDADGPSLRQGSQDASWQISSASLAIAAALGAASSVSVKVVRLPCDTSNEATMFSAPSEDFVALCEAQLDLCARVLAPGDHLTVYMRTPESYATGQLELRCVACHPGHHSGAEQNDVILLATDTEPAQGRAAETALVAHEAVELPERGALVLPLAKGSFVVGLLVAERAKKAHPPKPARSQGMKATRPVWPPPGKTPQLGLLPPSLGDERNGASSEARLGSSPSSTFSPSHGAGAVPQVPEASGGSPEDAAAKSIFSTREQAEAAKVAHTLALACVMDQRALLVQQTAWQKGVLMDGLLEEVRAPLVAFRSLGRMLLPQLRQGELSRDIVDTMLVQGDRVKEVFDRLQQTLYPTQGTERLMQYESPPSGVPPMEGAAEAEAPLPEQAVQQLLPAPRRGAAGGQQSAQDPPLPFTLAPFTSQQQQQQQQQKQQ